MSLKNRIILFASLAMVAVIGLLMVNMLNVVSTQSQLYENTVVKTGDALVHLGQKGVVNTLYEQQYSFTRNQALKHAVAQKNSKAVKDLVSPNFKRLKASGIITDLVVADAQGRFLAFYPDDLQWKIERLIQRVLSQQIINWDIIDDNKGIPRIAFAFPVYVERGKPAGVIVLMKRYDSVLAALNPPPGGGFMLRDQSGKVVFTTVKALSHLHDEALSLPTSVQGSVATLDAGGKTWKLVVTPLLDRHGMRQGDMVTVQDFTDVQQRLDQEWMLAIGGSILFIFLGLALLWWQFNRAFKPLENAMSALETVAQGDLSQPFQSTSRDEIGTFIQHIEQMRRKLHDMISEINTQAEHLSSAAKVTLKDSQAISEGITEEQRSLSVVNDNVSSMTGFAKQVAGKADLAAQRAQEADERAHASAKVVEQAIETINALAQEVDEAASVIASLRKDSQQIDEILNVIQEIAEQTNLLALNAAIEAARAGEHGRGFAVVADEVRSLASRTQSSVAEIEQMIQRLQNGTQQAVSVMETAKTKAEDSVGQSRRVREALNQIVQAVSEISGENREIAQAADGQKHVVTQVKDEINVINEQAAKITSLADENAKRSSRLMQLADKLHQMVHRFRL